MTREEKQKVKDAVERLNALKQLIGYDKDSEIVKATQKSLDMSIKALEQEPILDKIRAEIAPLSKSVTNQEYIATLPPDEFWKKIRWLQKEYGKRYNDSYTAIIEWLSAERIGEE